MRLWIPGVGLGSRLVEVASMGPRSQDHGYGPMYPCREDFERPGEQEVLLLVQTYCQLSMYFLWHEESETEMGRESKCNRAPDWFREFDAETMCMPTRTALAPPSMEVEPVC